MSFVNKNQYHNNKIIRRVHMVPHLLTIGIIPGVSALVSGGVVVVVVRGVGGLLPSDLLHGVNSRPHKVGTKVKKPNFGIGDIGDSVDGVEDGVLGLVASQPGQQAPGSEASERSEKRRVLEEAVQETARLGGGGGHDEGQAGGHDEAGELRGEGDHSDDIEVRR